MNHFLPTTGGVPMSEKERRSQTGAYELTSCLPESVTLMNMGVCIRSVAGMSIQRGLETGRSHPSDCLGLFVLI